MGRGKQLETTGTVIAVLGMAVMIALVIAWCAKIIF